MVADKDGADRAVSVATRRCLKNTFSMFAQAFMANITASQNQSEGLQNVPILHAAEASHFREWHDGRWSSSGDRLNNLLIFQQHKSYFAQNVIFDDIYMSPTTRFIRLGGSFRYICCERDVILT
jgi:hypothetical protein